MRRRFRRSLGESLLPFRHFRMLLDPDPTGAQGGGEGGGTTTTQADPPAPDMGGGDITDVFNGTATVDPPATPTPTPATTQGQPRQPADPNQRAGATPPAQAQTQAEWQSIMEAAQGYGYQFDPSITDDRAALVHLLQAAQANRQADFYAQLGRQLAPQAPQIQDFLATQHRQATHPAPGRQPWEAPEFDERWIGLVQHDPQTGLYVGKPGVPHEIVHKVNEYASWKANFDRNPAAVINGMVESRAAEIARKTFAEQFAASQREATINSLVAENRPWLYQHDAAGSPMVNPVTRQPMMTPAGARYMHHLQAVRQYGVTDPRAQDLLAKQLVRGEIAAATPQNSNPAQPQVPPAAQHRPNVNLLGSTPNPTRPNPAAPDLNEAGLSLTERLQRNFAANGITDADFANIGE